MNEKKIKVPENSASIFKTLEKEEIILVGLMASWRRLGLN